MRVSVAVVVCPTLVLGALAALPGTAAAQGCGGVTCSGHGVCMEEDAAAYCFCEEGYYALGHTCVETGPAFDPDTPPSGMHIVGVALAEEGHDLVHVGASRPHSFGPLSTYVGETGLWCSDFVAWVFRVAGIPFTGGYAGGWHLTNNHMIRSWYVRRGAFVEQGTQQWRHVRPLPGDYVRIHTRTWGHSAIVRYATDDELYTVEGNAGGHVITTHYSHWRTHERIDGIGLTTEAAARMNALDARVARDMLARVSD